MEDWKAELIQGYRDFRAGHYKTQKDLYEELGTKGQSPKILLIGCIDSRVDPSDIFNAYPGQMFVTRNVGNIVPSPEPMGAAFTARPPRLNLRSKSWASSS